MIERQEVRMKSESETRQAQVRDLGAASPEAEEHTLLWPGIYAIDSLYSKETLQVPAQGLLEIAAYVEQNRAKLEQEAATPQALELAADAKRRHEQASLSLEERNA
jgi:hypothetical protein